jgi:hypothetical protein
MPTDVPTLLSCVDSILEFKKIGDCAWVAQNPSSRCNEKGIDLACAKTCGTCDTCSDSKAKFGTVIKGKYKFIKCKNVIKDKNLCNVLGVADVCRQTCDNCLSAGGGMLFDILPVSAPIPPSHLPVLLSPPTNNKPPTKGKKGKNGKK